MSLLWVRAVSQRAAEHADIPLRFDHVPKGGINDGTVYEARTDHHPDHGSLAGYAHVSSLPDPEDPGGYYDKVHMIEVNPGHRGKGVGKALLNHVIDEARGRRVDPGGFTPEGAHLWRSVTGEEVRPTKRTDRPSRRDWRWA